MTYFLCISASDIQGRPEVKMFEYHSCYENLHLETVSTNIEDCYRFS